jgi:hypothetical protein
VDLDEPIEGICFHILTEFNLTNNAVKKRLQVKTERKVFFDAQATYPRAMYAAEKCATEIQNRFKGSSIKRIDPSMQNDDYHLYIVDKFHNQIAKIGVIHEDYREFTIH